MSMQARGGVHGEITWRRVKTFVISQSEDHAKCEASVCGKGDLMFRTCLTDWHIDCDLLSISFTVDQ